MTTHMHHPNASDAPAARLLDQRDSAAMFHVVFMDPADDAYVATEDEATQLIRSRVPGAVFAPWRGRSMRAYADETTKDIAESQHGSGQLCCSAFVIDLSKPNSPK